MNLREHAREIPSLRRANHIQLGVRRRVAARAWALRSIRHRRRLTREDAAIRRVRAGYLRLAGRIVDSYSSALAAAADLELVIGLLEEASIRYFLVPGDSAQRHVIGVEEAFRQELLDLASKRFKDTCAYVSVVTRAGSVISAALWADGKLPRRVRRAQVIRIGTVRIGPEGQLLGGLRSGCEVEFWSRGSDLEQAARSAPCPWLTVPARELGDDFDDALIAPRQNRVAEVVPADAQKPATVSIRGHAVSTFAPFAEVGIDEVRFPIDAVYTWVDGDDPTMAAKRRRYTLNAEANIAGREVGLSRYTSHDELKYSLRSLQMYAGFIRHIFIVTDGQRPDWLDPDAAGVTVVDHRDIFPAAALPVFNSHAIESRLHHIEGLSEHYLYFNDDVFINGPVQPEYFFYGSGIARIPFSPFKLGVGEPRALEPAPNSAGKNARKLILKAHGRYITHKSLHTPHPQIRSVLTEIADAGFEEFDRTTYSRFRSADDVATAATLHHHWALFTGRAVPGEYKFRYVDVGKPGMQARLARLADGEDVDFFCLNDVDTDEVTRDAVRKLIRSFLDRRFPFPSRAERPAHPPSAAVPAPR